jgi:hypothetical protein
MILDDFQRFGYFWRAQEFVGCLLLGKQLNYYDSTLFFKTK